MNNEAVNTNSIKKKKVSFLQYYFKEITHGHFMDKNDPRYLGRRERVYTFLKQPFEIEKVMIYGWLLCLDVLLYTFTFLPFRVLYAILRIISFPFYYLFTGRKNILDTALTCDILKGLLFVISLYLMSYIDTSKIYHIVRAQNLIKLYIIYNMLEVGDRLFSSFGQDLLDALFYTVTESKSNKRELYRLIPHSILAVLYITLQASLVLVQATTLNVAFNSHNKNLLTIMMANNFVEIKGTVFKKYDKNNLFQISCADVRERFVTFILMLVVLLRNMQQYSWSHEQFCELFPNMFYVILCEHFIDWFKHAFVVKFNNISIESYKEFRATLAYDVASSRRKDTVSDHSDVVSRRLGFIPLPIAVLIVHVVRISVDFNVVHGYIVIALGFLTLHLVKIVNSLVIVGQAVHYIKQDIKQTVKTQSESKKQQDQQKPQMYIIDPFEQRGNRPIIRPVQIRENTPFKATATGSDSGDFIRSVSATASVPTPVKKLEGYNLTTAAKERSMRPPSVDQLVTAGKCGALPSPTTNDSAFMPPEESLSGTSLSTTTSSTNTDSHSETGKPHLRKNSKFTAATTRTKLDFSRIDEES